MSLHSNVRRVTTHVLHAMKLKGEKIAMLTAYDYSFARLLDQAGIERRLSPHSLRHTLAVRLLSRTGNLRLVQRALGHASIASTVRYARVGMRR